MDTYEHPAPEVAAKAVQQLLELLRDGEEFPLKSISIERSWTGSASESTDKWMAVARGYGEVLEGGLYGVEYYKYAIYFDATGTFMEADGF